MAQKTCADTLFSSTVSSVTLNAAEPYISCPTFDGGTILLQNIPTTPQGFIIVRLDSRVQPVWSKSYIQNTNKSWIHLQETSDHDILLTSATYISGLNNTASQLFLLDSTGNFLWSGSNVNQAGDSGVQVVNTGATGDILMAGVRSSSNGGGLTVESFNYIGDASNWQHNYLPNLPPGYSVSVQKIWRWNSKAYLAGTFENVTASTGGIWELALDYQSGSVLFYNAFELHNSDKSADSLLPVSARAVEVTRDAEIRFTSTFIGKNGMYNTILVGMDSNLNILSEPSKLEIAPQSNTDIYDVNMNSLGDLSCSLIQPTTGNIFTVFEHADFKLANQFECSYSIMDLSNAQLNYGADKKQKVIIPQVFGGILSFVISSTSPDFSGGDYECFSIKSIRVASISLIKAKALPIKWVIFGFDNVTISSSLSRSSTNNASIAVSLCSAVSQCTALMLTGTPTMCLKDSVSVFTVEKNIGCKGATRWTFDSTFLLNIGNSNDSAISLSAIRPGFTILTAYVAGCGLTDSLLINIKPPAQVFIGHDTTLCLSNALTLNATPTNDFESFTWQDGTNSQSLTVNSPGLYYVTATDYCGLQSTDSVKIASGSCTNQFHMPNAFTPNRDGKNDQIRPVINGDVTLYYFSIYNRWGQLIFHTTSPGKGWDGTIANEPQPTTTYTWTCRYQFLGEVKKETAGTFVLIR